MSHNWSAMKQHLHLQSVAEISRHSVLSGDRFQQCETSSGSRHFLLRAPQCLCSMWKRFSRDHCCRERSKPYWHVPHKEYNQLTAGSSVLLTLRACPALAPSTQSLLCSFPTAGLTFRAVHQTARQYLTRLYYRLHHVNILQITIVRSMLFIIIYYHKETKYLIFNKLSLAILLLSDYFSAKAGGVIIGGWRFGLVVTHCSRST